MKGGRAWLDLRVDEMDIEIDRWIFRGDARFREG